MFEIRNIKVSLTIKNISLNSVLKQINKQPISYEIKNNYIIIRDKFIYIFFKSKNNLISHINVTKIPNLMNIQLSVKILKEFIFKDLNLTILNTKIDNITATCDKRREINQIKLLEKIKHYYSVKFNKEKFPGLFIKVPFGTFIIFHTGKINLVGCQNPFHLQFLYELLDAILIKS